MRFTLHRSGFSLVELSIVLVILGLLTGGILSGQSLIRAAQMRAAFTETQHLLASMHTFRDKYFMLPGDLSNATSFWGIAAGTGSDNACRIFTSTDQKTCNGNGDGILASSTGSVETYRLWQHLANAGFIQGSYTGQGGSYLPYINMLGSRVDSAAMWTIGNTACPGTGSSVTYDGTCGNRIALVRRQDPSFIATLSAEEVWNIDTKIDDGAPYSGRIRASWGASVSAAGVQCTLAADGTDKSVGYNFADTNKNCIMYVINW